ncbi:membrane lipoprotein lipid attachment site-containing protein [Flavobacterium sp. UBA7663]|uniref:membrane lipoprotein lipid attachment site-containing protein n=1 Tax=Flavobacterium sp. UBA7663 TaxID=1946557 RepID=UPI0025C0B164|nr:membrane lipoprotein lipid attachment site-containing protein [Flavobacterium sp. UBA7663]
MKKIISLIVITIFLTSCNDDDGQLPAPSPIYQLPPETQIGANTFGCLLDGEVFKPGLNPNSYQCFYQFVDGGYYFNVNANSTENNILTSLVIGTLRLQIGEGQTYSLYERADGNALGGLFVGNSSTGVIDDSYTSAEHSGELKISKLDSENRIVSGTFWYDIKDNSGIVHQIREGRFDMQFTQ